MKKSTRAIAHEIGLEPITVWTALKLMLKGHRVGLCCGRKHGKRVRITIL